MNINQINEEFKTFLNKQKLQERDRTFDDFDCDSYEEIVHGEYGGSMYIVTMNEAYFVYSKGDYNLTKEGKFESYQDALKYIADDIIDREDPHEIEEQMDMGDFDIYDDYVQERIKSWIEDSYEDDEEYEESFKTPSTRRLKKKLKECSDRDTIVELARKYGDNITLKDILAKIRNVDEKLSDQERKSTSKFMKRIEKIEKEKKQK